MTTTLAHWTVIAVAYVTSRFGLRRHPITGQWGGHPGLDKSHPTIYGTPVRAPFDGANIRGYQQGGAGSWVNGSYSRMISPSMESARGIQMNLPKARVMRSAILVLPLPG